MRCAACDASVTIPAGERVGFRDTCESCGVDLHVCLNCSRHDRSAYNECREPAAERIGDRERANRCDWFSPVEAAGGETASQPTKNLGALDALFKK